MGAYVGGGKARPRLELSGCSPANALHMRRPGEKKEEKKRHERLYERIMCCCCGASQIANPLVRYSIPDAGCSVMKDYSDGNDVKERRQPCNLITEEHIRLTFQKHLNR